MSKSYKAVLTFICILIIICLSLGITYLFYGKDVSESTIVLVEGNLSINFMDGNIINNKEEKEYMLHFSVSNNSNDVASYNINIVDVENNSKNISLVLTNTINNSVISEIDFPLNDDILAKDIQIASGDTHNYVLKVSGEESEFNGILKVTEEKPSIVTFAQTILNNNAVSDTTLTQVGEEQAIEDEGLISDIDDAGSTYYFRGNVKSNFVSFAGLTWRIVRINGDGTVKLILDSEVDTVQSFYTNSEEGFYKYDNANIKSYLESWYEYNLLDYDIYISLDKYCNDFSMTNETDYIYNSYVRNITNKIPTFNCLGKNVGAKIGLLTADEAIYAGALYQTNNTAYYLYNDKVVNGWWTMTPASGNSTSMNPFIINATGALENDVEGSFNRGVRPVISLIKDISVSGNGSSDNPYIILTK